MAVFVLDKNKKPLMPCSEKRARLLLERGRAVVVKMYPFTIRLKDRVGGGTQPLRVKIDPGSRYTGMALVRESEVVSSTGEIIKQTSALNLFQLNHRGLLISKKLASRSAMRRRRRSKLRYRPARFNNRAKPKGWLAPSLKHRVDTVISWVNKIKSISPITKLSQELVKFDIQKIVNPEISGIEYQQGELQGYEVREYLLEKWGRNCVYCNVDNVPLEIEHIIPKSKGGSNKVSNLTLACGSCNQAKGNLDIAVFLLKKPSLLSKIKSQMEKPLRDASAVNTTRWVLAHKLKEIFGDSNVELSSGGRTKFNRFKLNIPKSHALDAVCVGEVGFINNWNKPVLEVKCTGRGSYSRTNLNKYGFPRSYLMRKKSVYGFQTGDIVKAVISKGKNKGDHMGRIVVRGRGVFSISGKDRTVVSVSYKNCGLVFRNNGYDYIIKNK